MILVVVYVADDVVVVADVVVADVVVAVVDVAAAHDTGQSKVKRLLSPAPALHVCQFTSEQLPMPPK